MFLIYMYKKNYNCILTIALHFNNYTNGVSKRNYFTMQFCSKTKHFLFQLLIIFK